MNELLRKHGCNTIFALPEGMNALMSDISREVLREQPSDIYNFITNYLSALLVTREHGVLAVKILDDLCDCKPSTIEHLLELGLEPLVAAGIADILQAEIQAAEPKTGHDKVREGNIIKKVMLKFQMNEQLAVQICQIIRNAYKDYWYRKKLLAKKRLMIDVPEDSWEKAAEHTLRIYKTTKPTFAELQKATTKIQAAYRAYYIRKRTLSSLTKRGSAHNYSGPPVDIAGSREIDLGPFVSMQPKTDDNVRGLLETHRRTKSLKYDPLEAIKHRPDATDDHDSDTNSDHPSLAQMNVDLKKASEPYQFEVNLRKEDSIERRTSEIPNTPNVSLDEIVGTKLISFAKVPTEIDTETKEDIADDATEDVPEEINAIAPRNVTHTEVVSDVDDATNKVIAAADDDDDDNSSIEISTDISDSESVDD